jgi:hypothetical protein
MCGIFGYSFEPDKLEIFFIPNRWCPKKWSSLKKKIIGGCFLDMIVTAKDQLFSP